jgi:hypothetical protein
MVLMVLASKIRRSAADVVRIATVAFPAQNQVISSVAA